MVFIVEAYAKGTTVVYSFIVLCTFWTDEGKSSYFAVRMEITKHKPESATASMVYKREKIRKRVEGGRVRKKKFAVWEWSGKLWVNGIAKFKAYLKIYSAYVVFMVLLSKRRLTPGGLREVNACLTHSILILEPWRSVAHTQTLQYIGTDTHKKIRE